MFGREDYKYAAQVWAEEQAAKDGGDFYKLPFNRRCELYEQGLQAWAERKALEAEAANDRLQDAKDNLDRLSSDYWDLDLDGPECREE